MKLFIVLLIATFSLSACARGSKRPDFNVRQERKDADKIWRPCQDSEDLEPVGKLCNHVCIKISLDGNVCKEWKTNKKIFSLREDFLFFRDSTFVFIDEDNL